MTPEMLVTVLVWISVGLGSVVLGLLAWFATRIVGQLDDLIQKLGEYYQAFKEEIHKHDLRIARLEAWRDGISRPIREPDTRDST